MDANITNANFYVYTPDGKNAVEREHQRSKLEDGKGQI